MMKTEIFPISSSCIIHPTKRLISADIFFRMIPKKHQNLFCPIIRCNRENIWLFSRPEKQVGRGYIHTNFKLSANETLYLYNSETELLDKIDIPTLPDNISYGRTQDHSDNWLYYSSPTPGFDNNTTGMQTVTESETVKGAQVFISEVMSANGTTLYDADGDNEDWIELYNQTDHAISLAGYSLSDTLNDTHKWSFDENAVIQPGESMIVFASSKDKVDSTAITIQISV